MKFSRSISSLLLCCVFLAPARVYANDENISPLPKVQVPSGEKDPGNVLTVVRKDFLVPFTGILLSPRASAELIARMDTMRKQADLAVEKAREEQRIRDEAEIKGLQVELAAEKKSEEERLKIRDTRISDLQQQLAKAQADRPNPVTWTLVGAGATALIVGTLAAVVLVGSSK